MSAPHVRTRQMEESNMANVPFTANTMHQAVATRLIKSASMKCDTNKQTMQYDRATRFIQSDSEVRQSNHSPR